MRPSRTSPFPETKVWIATESKKRVQGEVLQEQKNGNPASLPEHRNDFLKIEGAERLNKGNKPGRRLPSKFSMHSLSSKNIGIKGGQRHEEVTTAEHDSHYDKSLKSVAYSPA
jgi:hypothetical protein